MEIAIQEGLRQKFKQAMRFFPATVSIVSCQTGGEWAGTTVTAVSSLSMDPPSLLVCINRSSSFYERIIETEQFQINVLQPCHEAIASEFAGRTPQGNARFLHGDWVADMTGPPRLVDARMNILCECSKTIDHGTHAILVGEVTQVFIQGGAASLYHDGSYGHFVGSSELASY